MSEYMKRYRREHQYFGADAPAAAPAPTVTGTAATLIHVATTPVKLALNITSHVANWLGGTLSGFANKL